MRWLSWTYSPSNTKWTPVFQFVRLDLSLFSYLKCSMWRIPFFPDFFTLHPLRFIFIHFVFFGNWYLMDVFSLHTDVLYWVLVISNISLYLVPSNCATTLSFACLFAILNGCIQKPIKSMVIGFVSIIIIIIVAYEMSMCRSQVKPGKAVWCFFQSF